MSEIMTKRSDEAELLREHVPPKVQTPTFHLVNVITSILIIFFHIAFTLIPFFLYLYGDGLRVTKLLQSIQVIVSSIIDFIYVNLAGKILLEFYWTFEKWNRPKLLKFRKIEKKNKIKLFWFLLFAKLIFWLIFLFVNFIQLNIGWFFVTLFTFSLSLGNVCIFVHSGDSVVHYIHETIADIFITQFIPLVLKLNPVNL